MITTGTKQTAGRTGLGRIGRVDQNYPHACFNCLVGDLLPKIVERPATEHFPQPLPLVVAAGADTGEVFKRNRQIGRFGFGDDVLAQAVVHIELKAGFAVRQAFQDTFRAFRPFTLERSPDAGAFLAETIQFLSADRAGCAESCDSIDAEIDAQHAFGVRRRLGHLDHEVDVEGLSLAVVGQRPGGRLLPLEQVPLIIAELQLDLLSARHRRNRNRFVSRNEANQVFIKIKACRAKNLRRAFLAEGLRNTRNRSADVVGCQSGLVFQLAVALLVNGKLVSIAGAMRNLQRLITGTRVSRQRGYQRGTLFSGGLKFAGDRFMHIPRGMLPSNLAEFQEGIALCAMRNSPVS